MNGRAWLAGLAAILALAGWLRVSQWPQVFIGDDVLPADGDASYHLYRIERSVETFPRVPVRDALLNWPEGGPCPWSPGLDFAGAALVELSGSAGDAAQSARIASLLPLLLGLLLTACAMAVARRLLPDPPSGVAVGWACGIALALIPQSVAIGRIARVDHHVAESLSMLLLAGWALAAIGARPLRARAIRFEIAGATCALFAGAMFSGAPLYVAIAALLLIGVHLLEAGESGRWSERVAGSGGPALLVAAPLLAWLNWGAIGEHGQLLSYRFPSLLQPVLYACAGVGLLAARLVQPLAQARPAAPRTLVRAAALAAGALLVLALLPVLAPGVLSQVWTGSTEWLGARDPWLASISEFQPLDGHLVYKQFGVFGVLAPLALPLGMWRLWRQDPARGAFFAVWTLALLPLALLEARFGRIFIVNLAIAWGLAALALVEALRPAAAPPLAACGLLLIGLLDPACREHLTLAGARDPSPIEAAAQFLRDAPREQPDGADGVLTDWEFGNDLIWTGRRPVLAGGFGYFTGAAAFQQVMDFPKQSEAQLGELMTQRKLGWLVTGSATFMRRVPGAQGSAPFVARADGVGVLNPSYFQSLPLAPAILGGTGLPALRVKHLAFLRPRFASAQVVRNLALPVPILWVYERVPGAVLQGRAPAGTPITASIQLDARGLKIPYVAWTSAAADGSYRLVIPLPSGLREGPLHTDAYYELRVGDGAPQPLDVTERAVSAGEPVAPHGAS